MMSYALLISYTLIRFYHSSSGLSKLIMMCFVCADLTFFDRTLILVAENIRGGHVTGLRVSRSV